MSLRNTQQTSFSSGEISPSSYGRLDTEVYRNGARFLENFIVRPSGGLTRRPGTLLVRQLESESPSALHSVTYSSGESFLLLFQDDKVRIFQDGSEDDFVLDLPEGYGNDFTISFREGVIYLADSRFPLKMITRTGDQEWEIENVPLTDGPYGKVLEDISWTIRKHEGSSYLSFSSSMTLESTEDDFLEVPDDVFEYSQSRSTAYITEAKVDGVIVPCEILEKISDREVVVRPLLNAVDTETVKGPVYYTIPESQVGEDNPWPQLYSGSTVFSKELDGYYIRVSEGEDTDGWYVLWGYIGPRYRANTYYPKVPNDGASGVNLDLSWAARTLQLIFNEDRFIRRFPDFEYQEDHPKTYKGTLTVSEIRSSAVWISNKTHSLTNKDVGRMIRFNLGGHIYSGKIAQVRTEREILVESDQFLPFGASYFDGYVQNGGRSDSYQLGSFYSDNHPSIVHFHQQRMILASSNEEPETIWGSVTGEPWNFSPTNLFGEVLDSSSFSRTLDSETVAPILWLRSNKSLIAGTTEGEWVISGGDDSSAITPTSFRATLETSHGSANANPVRLRDSIFFISRGGRKLLDLHYEYHNQGQGVVDLTTLADHLTASPGTRFEEVVHQKGPSDLLWVRGEDGRLYSLTHDRVFETVAWSRHRLGGHFNGGHPKVESLEVMDGTLYLVVRRTGVGLTLEKLAEPFSPTHPTDRRDMHFLDCGISYEGLNGTEDRPFDHLNGEFRATVVNGKVRTTGFEGEVEIVPEDRLFPELPLEAYIRARVGLPYCSSVVTVPPNIVVFSEIGAVQHRIKRVSQIGLNVENTYGIGFARLDHEIVYHELAEERFWNTPRYLFTGDSRHEINWDYGIDTSIIFQEHQPVPCNLLGVTMEITNA